MHTTSLFNTIRDLASLIKLVLIFLFVPAMLVIIDNLNLGIKPVKHITAEFGHPDLTGLFMLMSMTILDDLVKPFLTL